jgi:hypothetical protein
LGDLAARATEEWHRSYPAASLQEIEIANLAGKIDVEGGDGRDVEVVADRVVRAVTEKAARDLLTHLTISEAIEPEKVTVKTDPIGGIMIGASPEVEYHVKAPVTIRVRARTLRGPITLSRLKGRIVASTSDGAITGEEIGGGIEARAINENVTFNLVAIGSDPIDLRTTNGDVGVVLPADAAGTLLATTVSGAISVTGLKFLAVGEQTKRRVRGDLNGGGVRIELNAVRGNITVRARD